MVPRAGLNAVEQSVNNRFSTQNFANILVVVPEIKFVDGQTEVTIA
jgi:hypothetical protein